MPISAQKKQTLTQIAAKVRRQCEDFAMSSLAGEYDFYRKSDLRCMCATASLAIKKRLLKEGVRSRVIQGKYDGECHCWVKVGNFILDVTASQFGGPDVVVRERKGIVAALYKGNTPLSKHIKEWPSSQIPTPNIVNKILRIKTNA